MGWLYCERTRKDLIDSLVKKDGVTVYAHCTVGNVLWTVEQGAKDKIIGCYLMRRDPGASEACRWGYKDMDESAHPYYYTCPLSYLDMAPVFNEEWREHVRRYHAARNTKFEEGDIVELKKGYHPAALKVIDKRRRYGETQSGGLCRFKRTDLSGRVFKSWDEFSVREDL